MRLSGIDAPEKRQAFGQVSKQHLSDLAYDKTVSVVFHKRDRYKRILGKVLVNGADTGLNQIQSGLAWHYKRYEREQSSEDRVAYARAEETARAERRGLWRDPESDTALEFPQALTHVRPVRDHHPRFNRIEAILATTFPEVRPRYKNSPRHPSDPRGHEGAYEMVEMRWGLVPHWSKEPKTPTVPSTPAPRPWPRSQHSEDPSDRGSA